MPISSLSCSLLAVSASCCNSWVTQRYDQYLYFIPFTALLTDCRFGTHFTDCRFGTHFTDCKFGTHDAAFTRYSKAIKCQQVHHGHSMLHGKLNNFGAQDTVWTSSTRVTAHWTHLVELLWNRFRLHQVLDHCRSPSQEEQRRSFRSIIRPNYDATPDCRQHINASDCIDSTRKCSAI